MLLKKLRKETMCLSILSISTIIFFTSIHSHILYFFSALFLYFNLKNFKGTRCFILVIKQVDIHVSCIEHGVVMRTWFRTLILVPKLMEWMWTTFWIMSSVCYRRSRINKIPTNYSWLKWLKKVLMKINNLNTFNLDK